jgi:hypothetical protein
MKLLMTLLWIALAVAFTWHFISTARKLVRKEREWQEGKRKKKKKLSHT